MGRFIGENISKADTHIKQQSISSISKNSLLHFVSIRNDYLFIIDTECGADEEATGHRQES